VLLRVTEVRQQLSDQLRCLDQRVECHLGMVSELQDYYRRHSEIEMELSRSLEKLDKQIRVRHKAEKQRSVLLFSCTIRLLTCRLYTVPRSAVSMI